MVWSYFGEKANLLKHIGMWIRKIWVHKHINTNTPEKRRCLGKYKPSCNPVAISNREIYNILYWVIFV